MDRSILSVIDAYQQEAPVDVFAIIRELGIGLNIYPMHGNLSGLAGYIEGRDGGFVIGVNKLDHLVRQRFTAAHELGHYIYHRPLIGKGIDDTRAYRNAPGGKFYNAKIYPTHERQANQFASNLLMPRRLIIELRRHGLTRVDELANALKVSRPAMRIRLGLPPQPVLDDDADDFEDGEFDAPWEEPRFRR